MAGFSAAEETLYFRTVDQVHQALTRASSAEALLEVVRDAYAGFDRAFAAAPVAARARVACGAGCSACCHERVAVQAHEVLVAADHIQRTFSPDRLEALLVGAKAHRAAHEASAENSPPPRTPCVLLGGDGACTVYAARPEACRAHHSHTRDGCRLNLEAGYEKLDVKVSGVRGRMFAVMLGIDQALEAAGFDDHAYDFGSALHEALTDSHCLARWMRHEPAFSAACRER